MRYGIVVDSGCDADSVERITGAEVPLEKVPLKIIVGEQEFLDGIGFDADTMLAALDAYTGKTSTAAPSVGEWREALSHYDAVFGLTITGSLSGSYASAEAARKILLEEGSDQQMEILDTLSTGPEMTMLAEKLAELIQKKLSFAEISERIHRYQDSVRLLYVLQSVDNLVRNSRLSHLVGRAISVLNIRILGRASTEGRLEILQKCRGREKAYERLVETMLEDGYRGGKVVISHCNNLPMAELVCSKIRALYQNAEIYVMKAKGLNTYYAEKGGLLVGFERAAV